MAVSPFTGLKIKMTRRPRFRGPVITNSMSEQLGRALLKRNKERISSGITDKDVKAPPLKKRYAIFKSKRTKKAANRDMNFTGETLNNFTLRKATDKQIVAGLTIERYRFRMRKWGSILDNPKLGFNFFGYSEKEQKELFEKFSRMLGEQFRRMITYVRS